MMSIQIFLSRPNQLAEKYELSCESFVKHLAARGLKALTLGRTSYTLENPLDAVFDLMAKCDGAIILGYPQITISSTIIKSRDYKHNALYNIPTPWNQIEGVIAYSMKIPLLIISHIDVEGGIFDSGVIGRMVFKEDLSTEWYNSPKSIQLLELWEREVSKYGKEKSIH